MAALSDQLPPSYDYLERRVRRLEQQIRELGAASRLNASSFVGGKTRFKDQAGQPRFELGEVPVIGFGEQPSTNLYGTFVRGDDVGIVMGAREGDEGLIAPLIPIDFHPPEFESITSGDWTTAYQTTVSFPCHEVVRITFGVSTDAATNAEVRLFDLGTDIATGVIQVPPDYVGTGSFRWRHPADVGLYANTQGANELFLRLQARITAGAGAVRISWPNRAVMTSFLLNPGAHDNGDPVLL